MLTREKFVLIDINMTKKSSGCPKNCPIEKDEKMTKNTKRIFAWTRLEKIKVISIIPDKENPCQKLRFSLRHDLATLETSSNTDLPIERFAHDQIIFHNRSIDPFDEPKIDRMLTELGDETIIMIGISKSIILIVLGLLNRRKKVIVLWDATRFPRLDIKEREIVKRTLQSKGAEITTVKEFIEKRKLSRQKESSQTKMVMSV
ncbi:MAG: isochorismatase family protein [Deltaproteobacteria bacterium]|nr:isochorismatase family protein [Deltaproteobacteria bacterium]